MRKKVLNWFRIQPWGDFFLFTEKTQGVFYALKNRKVFVGKEKTQLKRKSVKIEGKENLYELETEKKIHQA